MDGILLIDKPSGWTSFDVVAKVRGILKHAMSQAPKLTTHNSQLKTPLPKVKVGHTGTLDPLATGLLVIVLGSYCKRAPEFSKLDKTYEVTMTLGQTSTTGDEEGVKTMNTESRIPNLDELQKTLRQFTGEIMQTPPAFSAIKVNGQRAYKLARAGKEVKLEPRPVTIYEITDIEYKYPKVKFTTKVSSGTYIRSLVEDIGKQLGTGAYMSALRRTWVGRFGIEQAMGIYDLGAEQINGHIMLA